MIYIIYSPEPEMARRAALKILKKEYPERNEFNYVSFNMADSTLEQVVDEVTSMSLFSEKKAIFCEDCAFLGKQGRVSKKAPKQPALLELAKFCENPGEGMDLFLVAYVKELDKNNPVVAAVMGNSSDGLVKEVPVPSDEEWVNYAVKFIRAKGNATLEYDAAKELVTRVGGNYGRFLNELEKLSCFGKDAITKDDIEEVVAPELKKDGKDDSSKEAFKLSNALTKGDIKEALRVYRNLKTFSTSEIELLNLLASQFLFMDKVRFLDNRGLDARSIASELKANPYRVEITLRGLYHTKPSAIPNILEQLYQAEKSILTGEGDPEFVFQRFLANFVI